MMFERKKIGQILVDLQVLTPAEVDRVLLALDQRCDPVKFGQVAREMGYLVEEHIFAALAVQMELFPNIQEMSLRQLMRRLRAPIYTPARLPIKNVRHLLKTGKSGG